MDLTTHLHNETPYDVDVDLVDELNVRVGSRRTIRAGHSIDVNRRLGLSDASTCLVLCLTLCIGVETAAARIMPIRVFENADIFIGCFTNPETNQPTTGLRYQRGGRSIKRLRMYRWVKDVKTYVGASCDKMMLRKSKETSVGGGGDLEGQ